MAGPANSSYIIFPEPSSSMCMNIWNQLRPGSGHVSGGTGAAAMEIGSGEGDTLYFILYTASRKRGGRYPDEQPAEAGVFFPGFFFAFPKKAGTYFCRPSDSLQIACGTLARVNPSSQARAASCTHADIRVDAAASSGECRSPCGCSLERCPPKLNVVRSSPSST